MRQFWLAVALALCMFAIPAVAQNPATPPQFTSAAEEDRFHDLLTELRCVMCQNQSLADSNAQIAVDLRKEVLTLMREGRSDEEVKAYLVQRYGEFVLYRPTLNGRNVALWTGPFVLLLLAVVGLWFWRRQRRPSSTSAADPMNDQKDIDW